MKEEKKEVGFSDLHLFGVNVHPLWGLVVGLTLIIFHLGIISTFGAILFVASVVALIVKAVRKGK